MIETRRGRCGEYSRLFFKAAEALNYRARWVVDWEVRRRAFFCVKEGHLCMCLCVFGRVDASFLPSL